MMYLALDMVKLTQHSKLELNDPMYTRLDVQKGSSESRLETRIDPNQIIPDPKFSTKLPIFA